MRAFFFWLESWLMILAELSTIFRKNGHGLLLVSELISIPFRNHIAIVSVCFHHKNHHKKTSITPSPIFEKRFFH